MENKFEIFEKEMLECVNTGDEEMGHAKADELLVEFIKANIDGSEKFLELYKQVAKWYA